MPPNRRNRRPPPGERPACWEAALRHWEAELHDPDAGQGSGSEDDFAHQEPTEEDAAMELGTMICEMKAKGNLTAKDACIMSWWACKSGVGGLVAQLAMAPGKSSGNYAKHFDRVLGAGVEDDDLYELRVPAYHRSTDSRVLATLSALPLHEAADEEIRSSADLRAKLEACRNTDKLPPAYWQHELVQRAPAAEPVYPYALYIDAVKFQRTDAVIGIWLCSLVSGLRQLCIVARKSELCSCGCHGQCTLHCLMTLLHWGCLHMARGVWPSTRHDGTPFTEADGARAAVSGARFGWRGVVLFVKCDMAEYVTSFGFASWSAAASPCPMCHCSHEDWGQIAGISLVDLPWRPKTFAEYQQACCACERLVRITSPGVFRTLRANLDYDRRKNGSRGRALLVDMPELGLKQGDRLVPGGDIWEVGQIDFMDPQSACRLLFWRRAAETWVRHRNPLFSEETGIVPERILVVDWLHALSLGVYKYFLATCLHILFRYDIFGVRRSTDDPPQRRPTDASMDNPEHTMSHVEFAQSVARMRAVLFTWYAEQEAAGTTHSKVQNLTPEMLGAPGAPKLGTWGAETNGILLFTRDLLRKREVAGRLPEALAVALTEGADSLAGVHNIIKESRAGACKPAAAQEFCERWKSHLHAMRKLGIEVRAKHHSIAHMCRKLLEYGTPALWACWVDESDNKLLANLALVAHRLVWSRRLLGEHRRAYGTRRAQRRRS